MMILPPLYIVGTGGFAKEVAQLAATIHAVTPRWQGIFYLAEHGSTQTNMPFGTIAGTDDILSTDLKACDVAIGIGHPQVRRKIADKLVQLKHVAFPNLIHPALDADPATVRMGHGNILARGVALTCDIQIGDHNIFNLNATVGHDCVIGSFNVINPGANISGGTHIGDVCLLGTGVQILEQVEITSGTTIGAGAVVTRSIAEPGIYTGIPARKR